jgi:enoyl-CoA hydratase
VERRGPVTVLTVDRQGVRNAYDPDTLHRLADALEACTADGTRAAVLTGAGTVSFSSGMDLKALAGASKEVLSRAVEAFDGAMEDPERVPLIAAVNGAATGGGFEIAMRCDLVVASKQADFRLPEVQKGIVPGGGGTLLPSRIPLAVALEIGMLGTSLSASRAFELGLVNRVVQPEVVVATAVAIGEHLARNGPRAVLHTRNLMRTTATEGAAVSWARTSLVRDDPLLDEEMREGVTAFLEKRPPRW